ncbi:MAG: peptidase M48 Ste24p [Gammaproteobacteria bacterium]|nr:MAG: peptidase M48 Ste24p [Gammaproteobacteria bacterium]
MRRTLAAAVACAVALAAGSCATNPESGTHHVVFTSVKGEQENSRRIHEEIKKFYGLYQDQALQDYVQMVGTRVARNTPIADWDFKFFVLDDDSLNAFTIGGGYVYIHRGLLPYLNSESELAAVLGHEIGHDVARHPARSQARGVLLGTGALATAILTGNAALAEMADIGATAWMQGYGRDMESEADRLGLEYAARSGYRPEAMGNAMKVFKAQEAFELTRAKDESRDPNIYHGVFSDHPAPDDRIVQATLGAANISTVPRGGWIDNRDEYLKAIDGLPYGSSREQGIVRDNRFYHAAMKLTMAFPKGWKVQNERDRLLITKKKESVMQMTLEKRPEKKSPREFLLQRLRGASIGRGDALAVNGMEGYALITRSGSPLDGGEGPVRWAVLYRGTQAFVIGAASRSSEGGAPLDDGVFMSSIETMRDMKPSEYPLAEPYRLKIIQATDTTRIDDYAKDMPVEKFKKEELRLLNGLYPKGEPKPGESIKVVQ